MAGVTVRRVSGRPADQLDNECEAGRVTFQLAPCSRKRASQVILFIGMRIDERDPGGLGVRVEIQVKRPRFIIRFACDGRFICVSQVEQAIENVFDSRINGSVNRRVGPSPSALRRKCEESPRCKTVLSVLAG